MTKRMKHIGKILEEMNRLAGKWRAEDSAAPRLQARRASLVRRQTPVGTPHL